MKLRITYTAAERNKARAVLAAAQEIMGNCRIHSTTAPDGVQVLYLSTREPKAKPRETSPI